MRPLGPIAQLGERRVRNAEVVSSILIRSTRICSKAVQERPEAPVNKGFLAFFTSILVQETLLKAGVVWG